MNWGRQQSDCASKKDFCYLPNRERKLIQWENSSQVPESLFKMRHKPVSHMGYFWRFTQSLEGLYSTNHKGFWSMTTAPEHYIKVTTVSIRLDKRQGQGLHLPQAQCLFLACLTDDLLEETCCNQLASKAVPRKVFNLFSHCLVHTPP